MARILVKLSKIAEEAQSDAATAFSGSVPECMAAALREYFLFCPAPSAAAMIRLGLSPGPAAEEYVYIEFALRTSRGGGLVVVKCHPAVVSFAGGPSGSVGSTAGSFSCSASAGGSFLGGVSFSTERCDPIVAGSSTLVVKNTSSSCRCSSDIGSFAGGSLLRQRPASCSTDRGGFPSRIFAGAEYTTDCSAAAAYSGSSIGSARRFPVASPIAVSGSSVFTKPGGSLVHRRLSSYSTKADGAADGATDCGGCPRRTFLEKPSGNEEKLYKMIEEVHVAQGRDYYNLKRTCLELSEELNACKATHRDAMIAARHQVGVTAFKLFLALGGFCGFLLRDVISYVRDERTGVPLVVVNAPPAAATTTPSLLAATTTPAPPAATTTPSPAVST